MKSKAAIKRPRGRPRLPPGARPVSARPVKAPVGRPKVDPDDASSRDKLLAAAVRLFSLHGYSVVSTGDVATAAGLTQSMVHYHFRSKSKLWKASMDKMMRDRGHVFPVARLDLRDLDPLSRLKVIARRFLAASAAYPEFARIGVQEGMVRSPRLRWLVLRYVGATYRLFDHAVQEAMDRGLIQRLPVQYVTMIIMNSCAMAFIVPAWIKQVYGISLQDDGPLNDYSDTLIAMIFQGLQIKRD